MIPFIESAKDEVLAKIDALKTTIDRLISSSQGSNPNIALGNLSNKIDALKQNVDSKSSQTTVNKVGQDLNNIGSTITSKIGNVETKVNQTNTTLATKANQNTVDAVASNINQIHTALAAKASQDSITEIKKLLVPNRAFKHFRLHDINESLNRNITLVDINGKSGEFLTFYISAQHKTIKINATIKIIIDGVTFIDIDYKQEAEIPSPSYSSGLSLSMAPIESMAGGSSRWSRYMYPSNGHLLYLDNNNMLRREDGYSFDSDVMGFLPVDKIPFKKSLKIIVSSNAAIRELAASCYINK